MAKRIKFNLICDGYPVRTIEELQEHFAIEDILDYYNGNDKLLLRWLELREFNDELSKVKAITATESKEIIKDLARIFGVDIDEDDIDSYFRSETYRKERDKRYKNAAKADLSIHTVIEQYRLGYLQQIKGLESSNAQDRKFAVEKLAIDYKWALELDMDNIIERFKCNKDISNVFEFIKNPLTRRMLLDTDGRLKKNLLTWIQKISIGSLEKAGAKRKTLPSSSQYKIVEPEGILCMVISCEDGIEIKSCDEADKTVYGNYEDKAVGKVLKGLKANNTYSWTKPSFNYLILDQ